MNTEAALRRVIAYLEQPNTQSMPNSQDFQNAIDALVQNDQFIDCKTVRLLRFLRHIAGLDEIAENSPNSRALLMEIKADLQVRVATMGHQAKLQVAETLQQSLPISSLVPSFLC